MKIGKYILLPLAIIIGAIGTTQAYQNCDAKKRALTYQLNKAQSYGNYHRVMGLKRALANVNRYCHDSSGDYTSFEPETEISYPQYHDDTVSHYSEAKLRKKILDKKQDLIEIDYDIQKARAKGKMDKIAKLQRKKAKKQAKIDLLQSELNAISKR